jgi:hypothetical protein
VFLNFWVIGPFVFGVFVTFWVVFIGPFFPDTIPLATEFVGATFGATRTLFGRSGFVGFMSTTPRLGSLPHCRLARRV